MEIDLVPMIFTHNQNLRLIQISFKFMHPSAVISNILKISKYNSIL